MQQKLFEEVAVSGEGADKKGKNFPFMLQLRHLGME